jgi:hypothetical protein
MMNTLHLLIQLFQFQRVLTFKYKYRICCRINHMDVSNDEFI